MSVVVVTGAGRGIGRAIAPAFAARGHDVALLGRTTPELERTAAEVVTTGQRALAIRCDVARADEVERARDSTLRELGTPNVVVNNAGIVRRAHVVAMKEDDWDDVINVNLRGTFLVTRAFLPSMLEKKSGRCVALSSISGTLGGAKMSAYCASKWGIIGFVKALAEELRGSGLQAMCVMPGSVDTEMLRGSALEPEMTAEDVANVVLYASLDAPSAMNGSAIEVFG